MTALQFRPLFERVADDFGLSAEVRDIAWSQCFARAKDGQLHTLKRRVVGIYTALAATKPPFRASC